MNKKYPLLIVVLLGIVVFAGCSSNDRDLSSNERDLSKPSTRLVAHWGYFVESEEIDELGLEWHFGKIDDDGVGSLVGRFIDATTYAQYRVLSESGDTMIISMFVGTEPNTQQEILWRTETIEVAPDGQSMTLGDPSEYQYIDSKTEP